MPAGMRKRGTALLSVVAVTSVVVGVTPSAAGPSGDPPGAPGRDPGYASADKQGFGTARSAESPVWFTLGHGGATDLYYPNLSTPASRGLQVVVTDGEDFVQRLSDVPTRTEPVDAKVPAYRQTSTGSGWEATVTYVTDPARTSVLVDLEVESRTGERLRTYVVHEPTLTKDGADDRSRSVGDMLVAWDKTAASALLASPRFEETSSGYLGTSDGWTDLAAHKRLTASYDHAGPGHLGQVGRLPVDGVEATHAQVTLGYGTDRGAAIDAARQSSNTGFDALAELYAAGWEAYAASLDPAPDSLATEHQRDVYWSSLVMLAASEDKQNTGGFVASPSMPWAWRNDKDLAPVPGPYHLVWPRDLYQHATALLAAGDEGAAHRAWQFLMSVQEPDGHFPQNTETTGEPHWTNIQLDETALPLVLAWQLDRTDPASLQSVRKAAEFLVGFEMDGHRSPWTPQERWENQSGYSPGTIAASIAGLVCAADLLERGGDPQAARRYRRVADEWAAKVDGWTATRNGRFSPKPYYLRLSKEGDPNVASPYNPGDNYPREVDQRTQVDPSFLELVRLGIKPADDPIVTNTVEVVDRVLSEQTPAGVFWHRFTSDGYGEEADGSDWNIGEGRTYGRLWPIFAGERGEYELLAGQPGLASQRLTDMAAAANQGLLLPEQVWDNRAPADDGQPRPGTPTRSATPLAWTHGQYVRLAWSIDAGAPVERPSVVVDRYAGD
ncbi:MAG TPA: glycoside hydrolase family 15 protein [Nocardioidaceae bacterium]|nr:glycoside hydrolase family 15 protein [Nocardioidaceae bacterium]